jgi:hypothetical protein
MSSYISFRCTSCNAKLRVSIRLVGKTRACPACREHLVFQPVPPPPADPIVIFEDVPLPPRVLEGWNVQV